jgi:hypothetical protein
MGKDKLPLGEGEGEGASYDGTLTSFLSQRERR